MGIYISVILEGKKKKNKKKQKKNKKQIQILKIVKKSIKNHLCLPLCLTLTNALHLVFLLFNDPLMFYDTLYALLLQFFPPTTQILIFPLFKIHHSSI